MNEGHDLVRPYIMTGGRTRAQRRDLRVETLLQTKGEHIPPYLPDEQQLVLDRCVRALSVAEVAAHVAEVLWVLGQEDEAREFFQRAHELDPENRSLQRSLEMTGVEL